MKLVYRLLPLFLFFFFIKNSQAQLPTKCFEIQSILVDACGSPEGENEQVRLLTGPNPILLSGLTATWASPVNTNPFKGWCQNATSALKVDSLNQTILRCGRILEPPLGVIPPYAQVVFFTSLNMITSFNSFANLTDTIYAVFQCAGNTQGHFANQSTNGASQLRTTIFAYNGGCEDTAVYNKSQLVKQNGAIGAQDGGGVLFDFAGNPTYYNNGCQAAIPISTVFAGEDTAVCPNSSVLSLNGRGQNIKGQRWVAANGMGTFSQADSLNTTYTLSSTDNFPLTFYLKGYISCKDSIFDTIVFTKQPSPINAGTDAPLCAGNSIILFATGGSNYRWSPATGVSDTTAATPTITPTVTTDYILKGEYATGCIGFDTIRITINSNDTIRLTADTTICLGQSVQLLATNISSGIFSPATALSCSTCVNPVATPISSTKYCITSSGACPDTKCVNVTVSIPIPLTVPVSACGSVTYKGITYTSNTTILDTLHNIRGCDSLLVTANLTISPFKRDTVQRCIQQGQSYLAGGMMQTTAGLYSDTVSANGGCDTVRITNLRVVSIQKDSVVLQSCGAITYKGNTYVTSTILRDTVFTSLGCIDSIRIANLIVQNNAVTFNRAVCILQGQSYFVGGRNQTTSGIYRDTIAVPLSCDTVIVTDLQVKTVVVRSNPLLGCNQVTFGGSTYTSSTMLRDTLRGVLGCDSVQTNTVITIFKNDTTIYKEVCILKGQSYNAGGANQIISGTYIDTFTRITGCDSIINTRLQVVDTVSNIINVPAVCGAVTYNGTTYTASTVLTTKVLSRLGCDSVYNVVNITVKQPTTITQAACINPGQSYVVGTKTYTMSGNYTDTLVAANGCDSIVKTNLALITPIANTSTVDGCDTVRFGGGVYTANTTLNNTILSAQGCDSIFSTVQIRVHPTYSYKITADKPMPLEVGESVTLSSNFNGTSPYYNWKPNQFITSGNNQLTITVSPISDIVYTMDYFVADSTCKLLDTFRVTVKQLDPKFELPNAFSPNNDGVNDLFRVLLQPGLELKAFRVFNRWGELVFEEKETSFGWNGMYKDVAQPVGVYVYYVEIRNLGTGKTNTRSGNVTLLR